MRPSLLFIVVLTFFVLSLQAQSTAKVWGRVLSGPDAVQATVALLHAADSTTLKYTVTGEGGRFVFEEVPAGRYLVMATSTGYLKKYSAAFDAGTQQQLPDLQLLPAPKSLAAVTVQSKRPLIEQRIDRTIVNVDASITNTGSNALEVLEKAPGVRVDKDGNISLKGKDGVLVLVDGRPTQLSGVDLAALLRNMNAAQLDQVEIMTNPPARYDAEGNAGIINIKTKKSKASGYNGSVNVALTQGRYPKTSEGFNFSYRNGKLAVFTNFSHNYRKNIGLLTIQRNIMDGSGAVLNYFDQESKNISEGRSYNGKLGLDYFATKKTTIGIVFNGFSSSSGTTNSSTANIATAAKEPSSITRAVVANQPRWKNFSSNVNFRTVLDTTGRELTADLDYLAYGSSNHVFMENAYFDAEGDPVRQSDSLLGSLPQDIEVYSGRMDYVHPLKKGRLEAGIKSSVVGTDNNAAYDSIRQGTLVHDYGRSNHFQYEESVQAAYINGSRPLSKKLEAQLGLRFEHTVSKGNQRTTGQDFRRQYAQLFPTAYLQYKLDKKNNLSFNYGRRIRRPNYESLNPFIRFMDRYTYNQGNPDLKPQLSQNAELSHTHNNWITTTVNYTVTTDIIQSVIEQKGQEAYARHANIASLHQYGLSVNLSRQLAKWWTGNLFMNVYNNRYEGVVNGTSIAFQSTTLMVNGAQQFKISKTLAGEISGFYRTGGIEGVVLMQPMGMLSAGFSQQLMKNKGTLRLNVRDIFFSQRARAVIRYGNVDARFQEWRDSRQVSLGFSYRFSKGKTAAQRKRSGSAGEEENRISVN